ncbi:MAG: hypothetical protein HY023_08900 [Chloroflexi bacterium]|nr:hypothetical protein [Chloroflexota bacterium]
MNSIPIGRMLRSSTAGFTFGCSVPEPEVPTFGTFVKAPAQRGQAEVIGLIYDIVIEDDPFVRQMVAAPNLSEAYIEDQRQNRQVPVEVSVLAVGYQNGAGLGGHAIRPYTYALPPQPPITLDHIHQCADDEVRAFTERFDYFRLVLDSRDAPADELLAASLRRAAAARPPEARAVFLLNAGKELARLLAMDVVRLENLLRRIRP